MAIDLDKPLNGAGLAQVNGILNGRLAAKQDKLTGTAGQVVGFNQAGEAVAQEAAGGGGVNYSAQETVIGTWVDGRPVYRKCYSLSYNVKVNYSSQTLVKNDPDLMNIDRVLSLEGTVTSSTYGNNRYHYTIGGAFDLTTKDVPIYIFELYVYSTEAIGNIELRTRSYTSPRIGNVTIIATYIKTTDLAE